MDNKETINSNDNLKEFTDPKDSNSIYLYLKDNPSLLIAILTFISTIALGVATFLLYLVQASYLSYWNISDLFVNVTDKTQLFSLIVILLSLILVCFITSYSSYKFSSYNNLVKADLYYLKVCRDLISESKKYPEIKSNTPNEARKIIRDVRFNLLKLFGLSFIRSLPSVVIVSLLLIGLYYSYFNSQSYRIALTLIGTIYSSQLIIYVLKIYLYKKDLQKGNYKYSKPSLEDIDSSNKREPIPEALTNKRLKNALGYALTYLVCIYLLMSVMGSYTAEHKSEFSVTTHDEITYVEIYKSRDYVLLEKAELKDNEVTVYCNEQLFLDINDYKYSIKKFDKVNKVE